MLAWIRIHYFTILLASMSLGIGPARSAPQFNAASLDVATGEIFALDLANPGYAVEWMIPALAGSSTAIMSGPVGGRELYVLTDPGTTLSQVYVVTVDDLQVVSLPAWGLRLHGLAVDPLTGRVFVSLEMGGSPRYLGEIDIENQTLTVLSEVSFVPDIGTGLGPIAFSPSGELFSLESVAQYFGSYLWKVDITRNEATLVDVTDSEVVGNHDITFLGADLWAVNSYIGVATQIDPADASTVGTVAPGPAALHGIMGRPCFDATEGLVVQDEPGDTGGQMRLDWSALDVDPNATEYEVYVSLDPCELADRGGTLVGATPGTSFVDTLPKDFEAYFYRVDAIDKNSANKSVVQKYWGGPGISEPNVLINEFAPAGGVFKDGEFVEIQGLDTVAIDLTCFRLSDGENVETLNGATMNGFFTTNLTSMSLPDAGGTLLLMPPGISGFVLDEVSYGNAGGAPTAPWGYSISRVDGTDSRDPDVESFALTPPTAGVANDAVPANLGSSVVMNEVFYGGPAGVDYVEIHNPLATKIRLEEFAVSDGVGFVDTLTSGILVEPGTSMLLNSESAEPFDHDLVSDQLYLYRITETGQFQLIDQLGWGAGVGDPPPPGPSPPDESVVRIPDGVAVYLGDAGTNWIDCGGDQSLFYGLKSPGAPNVLSSTPQFTVDPAGGADFTSIVEALDVVDVGSKLFIRPGVYTESVELRSGVEIVGISENGQGVVLQGDGINPALRAQNVDATARVCNVEVTSAVGGAELIDSSAVLQSVRFVANRTIANGGAVRIDGGAPVFHDCVFEDNLAEGNGGAVFAIRTSAYFSGCLFVSSDALEGGAIFASDSDVAIEHSVFDRTFSRGAGSAAVHSEAATIDIAYTNITYCLEGIALGTSQRGSLSFGCGALFAPTFEPGPGVVTHDVILADPVYCQRLAMDYTYSANSPLLALESNCSETIGIAGPPCTVHETPVPPVPLVVGSLGRARPNPFNPRTTLSFEIVRPSRVELDVHDVRGRLIAQPIEGESFPAGAHEVSWAGMDRNGATVASGVYYVRLRVDGQVVHPVRPITLLK